jgi:MFS family permease
LADVAILRYRPVLITNTTTIFMGFAMFSSFIVVPQIVQAPASTGYGFGGTATTSGLVLLPGALAMMIMAPASGALGTRFGNKVPLTLGCSICALGLILLGVEHRSEVELAAFHAVNMIGICLAYAALPNLIVEAVPSHRTGEATGFNQVLRSVGSSLGAQVTATVLSGSVIAASGFPTDDALMWGFFLGAAIAIGSGLIALAIPRRFHTHLPVGEELAAAAAPLPGPVLVSDR